MASEHYRLGAGYRVVFESPDDGRSYFFGYYDKSPLNAIGSRLLAHRVAFDGRDVEDNDVAVVGYFDTADGSFIEVAETLAWNWQQGAQLQWLPPEYSERLIYNDIEDDRFVSRIHDLGSGETRTIPYPVYMVHPNGREALGINFERHYWCRPGYNYRNIKNTEWDRRWHPDDGIFHIDLTTGNTRRIISMQDIIDNERLAEFDAGDNWLEHMMYNPSGSHFMFFHRWNKQGNDQTRAYIADSDGRNPRMLPDVRFYSHAAWKNDRELTIWTLPPVTSTGPLGAVRKVLNRHLALKTVLKPLYVLYDLMQPSLSPETQQKIRPSSRLVTFATDDMSSYEVVGDGLLSGNGHQTWFSDETRLLNDTYQDENGERTLMIYDAGLNRIETVGTFRSLYNDSAFRCDLHPRLDHEDNHIIIDSAHESLRKVLVIGH